MIYDYIIERLVCTAKHNNEAHIKNKHLFKINTTTLIKISHCDMTQEYILEHVLYLADLKR